MSLAELVQEVGVPPNTALERTLENVAKIRAGFARIMLGKTGYWPRGAPLSSAVGPTYPHQWQHNEKRYTMMGSLPCRS
jgi:hypothetical protein